MLLAPASRANTASAAATEEGWARRERGQSVRLRKRSWLKRAIGEGWRDVEVHMFVKRSRSSGSRSGDGDGFESIGCWDNQAKVKRQMRREGALGWYRAIRSIVLPGLFERPTATATAT